ncbi:serine/threonine-protein kinase ICK-like isoform X1 [Alosa sapidissima]|uniref:serine/threonine-protein kinase ICK-like isoform X1 n=1 Tax=Alosa sapidissima TaxID=34773 RepID=UPI001C082C38|nr:serine/threonine-protein kinase ICK-like isoform X1 [Alosa sapidissima]XP_041922702.1 serine/threonine-protein kinase ICK-like isoform X1 [Alosa sapidissima]
MNRYTTLRQLGDGTYGSVNLGRCLESGELVAIKKMKKKFYSWEECINLREVKSLKKLNHANVVKLKEVIRENDHLYFVFEYMKENLYQLMKERTRLFPESAVRNIMFQILQGLAFIHKHGFFHRDLKPENLLCMGPELVKIADFGLAREIRSRPPYTDYVSTRWYRAPEVLLRSTSYSSPIDQWAVGCIMAELYTLRPLFPGSSEIDTIFKICQVLGTPRKNEWPEGLQLASAMNFRWPQCVPTSLRSLIPSASTEAIQLMKDLLQWDPKKRPTTSQALRYSYFYVGQALGTPQQILDQGRPQASQPLQPLGQQQQQPLPPPQFRPAPPAQPPPHPQPQPPQRPLQQIQPPSAPLYQRHSELIPDPSICTVKQQQAQQQEGERGLQTRFPVIRDKSSQSQESENANFSGFPTKPKAGRRRWGHTPGGLKDDWDDYEDIETTITLLGKTSHSTEKRRQAEGASSRFGNVSNFSPTIGRYDVSTNLNNILGCQDQSRTASAKQHYLKQSRYLPGLSTKKNVAISSTKDFSGNHLWGTSTNPTGGTLPLRGHHGTNTLPSGYTPSFYKKEPGPPNPRVQLAPICDSKTSNYATWRSSRSQTGAASYVSSPTKSTPAMRPRPPVHPIHGRTDWSAKYGHN